MFYYHCSPVNTSFYADGIFFNSINKEFIIIIIINCRALAQDSEGRRFGSQLEAKELHFWQQVLVEL